MAAGRVSGTVDLRKRGGELAGATKGAQQIATLLDTLGKNEQVRQERQALERVSAAIAAGAGLEGIQEAANQPAEFDKGISGFIQRLGVGNQPSPGGVGAGVNRSIINDALGRALSGLTPEEQRQSARVKAGIAPRAGSTTQTGISQEEKNRDRDGKILSDVHLSGNKKGELKHSTAARDEAKGRLLKNPSLRELPQDTEMDFAEFLEDADKEKVKGGGAFVFSDKAFGKSAYEKLIMAVETDALIDGVKPESAKRAAVAWWDEKAELEKNEDFRKFVPRSEFQENDLGLRPDGTKKGKGFLGVLSNSDGSSSTEFSISSSDLKVNGKEIDFPTLVPTLTQKEIESMTNDIIPNGKRIPDSIFRKSLNHARKRLAEGKNVFADNKESPKKDTAKEDKRAAAIKRLKELDLKAGE